MNGLNGLYCVLRDIILFLVAHTQEPNKPNKGLRVLRFLTYNSWSKMWSLGLSPWNKIFWCRRGEKRKLKLAPTLSASTKTTTIMAATPFFLLVFLSEKSWFSFSLYVRRLMPTNCVISWLYLINISKSLKFTKLTEYMTIFTSQKCWLC